MLVNITRGKEEYELKIEYAWQDRRLGLVQFDIQEVTKVGDEEDIDPTLFTESLTDDEIVSIESQIKDQN